MACAALGLQVKMFHFFNVHMCVCVQGAVQRLKTKLLRYGVKINVDIVAAAAPAHYLALLMSCCQCKCVFTCVCTAQSVLHIYVCPVLIESGLQRGILVNCKWPKGNFSLLYSRIFFINVVRYILYVCPVVNLILSLYFTTVYRKSHSRVAA